MKTLSVNTKAAFTIFMFVLLTLVVPPNVTEGSEKESSIKQNGAALVRVDSKYICMINDQHSNKEQIPVNVEGKTYYGCCNMCKAKLERDAQSRSAVDPVSGKKVDKALSVIGVTPDGRAYYFENEKNLQQFKDTASQ